MKPITFKGQNYIMGTTQPEYLPLPTCRYKNEWGHVTSCWHFSWRDLVTIVFTRKIYLTLATFNKPIQPQKLTTFNPTIN